MSSIIWFDSKKKRKLRHCCWFSFTIVFGLCSSLICRGSHTQWPSFRLCLPHPLLYSNSPIRESIVLRRSSLCRPERSLSTNSKISPLPLSSGNVISNLKYVLRSVSIFSRIFHLLQRRCCLPFFRRFSKLRSRILWRSNSMSAMWIIWLLLFPFKRWMRLKVSIMSLSNNINRNRPPWRQRWSECTKRLQRQRERQWASPQLLNPSQLNLQSLSPWRPNRLHLNLRWWMVSILRWILTPTAISTLITTITSILILINNLNNKLDCVFYSCWSLYSWNPLW